MWLGNEEGGRRKTGKQVKEIRLEEQNVCRTAGQMGRRAEGHRGRRTAGQIDTGTAGQMDRMAVG